jgi:hypothetical protein
MLRKHLAIYLAQGLLLAGGALAGTAVTRQDTAALAAPQAAITVAAPVAAVRLQPVAVWEDDKPCPAPAVWHEHEHARPSRLWLPHGHDLRPEGS